MPRAQTKRHEQIYAQMIARTVARSSLSDIADTSVWKHVLAAAARQDDEQYYQHSLLLQLFSIDSAADDDLDERAKEIQPGVVTRVQATKALGSVVFSRAGTTGTQIIPINQQVKTPDGVLYTTTESGLITPSSVEQIAGYGVGRNSNEVSMISNEVGSAGLVAAGSITKFVTKVAGVNEVTNVQAVTQGGFNKETDDAFRARLKAYIASLARCTVLAIEAGVIGQQDPDTFQTILFAKLVEDEVNRGYVTAYIDDGTGSAQTSEEVVEDLTTVLTWNGTTTITGIDPAISVGDWIRHSSLPVWFQVDTFGAGSTSIIQLGSDPIPTGAGLNTAKAIDILTEGLAPGDVAVGGETRLYTDFKPIHDALGVQIATSQQGHLSEGVGFTANPATGLIVFTTPLIAGEQVACGYTRFTGLLAFAQKVIDGDRNDRITYPGFRAGGVLVQALSPQVLIQNVEAVLAIAEGYDQPTIVAAAKQALKDHINGLSISGDVLRAKLFQVLMDIGGVFNVNLITPASDIILLDDQLARTRDINLNIV